MALETVLAQRVMSADMRGSSWPILVETSAGVRFVKLRGAGQGTPPLVAEIVVAALAEAIGLRVPRRSLVVIEPGIQSLDRRDELRDLIDRSAGLNLGFDYLDGARMFTSGDAGRASSDDAAAIVWLDALVMNPDRTARNPNMMWWRDQLWLIDHGAAFAFQYSWGDVTESAPSRAFTVSEPHVLQGRLADIDGWDEILGGRLTRETLEAAVADVPDDFLIDGHTLMDGDALVRRRAAYVAYLWKRLKAPREFYRSLAFETVSRRQGRPSRLK